MYSNVRIKVEFRYDVPMRSEVNEKTFESEVTTLWIEGGDGIKRIGNLRSCVHIVILLVTGCGVPFVVVNA